MKREEVNEFLLKIKNKNLLLELPTSFGKTKIALDILNSKISLDAKILIVIPRLILINNWKEEFRKWGYENYLNNTQFVTYVSLPKLCDNRIYDIVIFDEAHHLSERCREALSNLNSTYNILLSATVNKNIKYELSRTFSDLYTYKISTRKAINEEVLPDPTVYLIPLQLDNTKNNCTIIKNKNQKSVIKIKYSERFNYTKVKNKKIIIECTQKQYYEDCSSMIAWCKNRSHIEIFKNMFLRKSGERLKWLSEQKTEIVKNILKHLENEKTLTFCNSINQTKELGKYCINSSKSKKENDENITKFNKDKIKHITSCNILDEGINLQNCKVGIYASLNSSERMVKQKLGRLLRHKKPIIIIPYYKNTRDEELVKKMLEDYNKDLVYTVSNITDIKIT